MLTNTLTAAFAGALMVATATTPPGTEPITEPITVELLTPRSAFTDAVTIGIDVTLDGQRAHELAVDDPSNTVVAKITVQPGAAFPWHTHPGPVLVNVSAGELIYVRADDCAERHYPTGAAFVDPGQGSVHTASNPSGEATILIATFFQVPADGPLTITEGVSPPTCDVEVGTSH